MVAAKEQGVDDLKSAIVQLGANPEGKDANVL